MVQQPYIPNVEFILKIKVDVFLIKLAFLWFFCRIYHFPNDEHF